MLGLPQWLSGKKSPYNAGDAGDTSFNPWIGKTPWKRPWQLTPVFSPGGSHGQRSLAGYSPSGCKEWTQLKRLSLHRMLLFMIPPNYYFKESEAGGILFRGKNFGAPLKDFWEELETFDHVLRNWTGKLCVCVCVCMCAFSVLIQVLMQSKYCRHPVLGIPAVSTKKFVGSLGCVLNEIGMQAVDSMDELTWLSRFLSSFDFFF